jgi:hypothetical protein
MVERRQAVETPDIRLLGGGRGLPFEFTVFVVSDTHYGNLQNQDDAPPGTPADAIERLVVALNTLPGKPHVLGGIIERPRMVFNLGDCVHHDTDTITRFAQDFKRNGTGDIQFPCYVMDGNHDDQFFRDHIIATQGSLFWGVKVGHVWFQAMRDNITNAPTQAQIETEVAAALSARPAGETTVIMHHRSLDPGYSAEWDAGAKTALETLSNSKNTLFHLHGHNHYTQHITWTGGGASSIRMFSPGSITQSPIGGTPPYATTYPEGILVIRFFRDRYDVADFNFGYDVLRNWAPNTWNWSETVLL